MISGTAILQKSQANSIVWVSLLYYVLMCFLAPGFFSVYNTWNLLYSFFPLLIAAIGQTFVIITAGIDLSITSVIALCSVAGGYLMSTDTGLGLASYQSISLAFVLMLICGACIGLINGLSVTRLGMPAFMVTLISMIFFSGLAIWFTQSQNIYNLPEPFVNMPYTFVLGLPVPTYIGLAVLLLAYVLLARTLWGDWIYAVGLNSKVSRISGVKVNKTIVAVYVFSGLCAALASFLYTARLETGSPVMGQALLLDIIGGVVIGGTSLYGGKGKIHWTFFGVLFIVMLDNSLNLIGLSYFLIMMVKGLVILLAAMLNLANDRLTKPS
jgi:ribose transport system permease protein